MGVYHELARIALVDPAAAQALDNIDAAARQMNKACTLLTCRCVYHSCQKVIKKGSEVYVFNGPNGVVSLFCHAGCFSNWFD